MTREWPAGHCEQIEELTAVGFPPCRLTAVLKTPSSQPPFPRRFMGGQVTLTHPPAPALEGGGDSFSQYWRRFVANTG
jgi:hypothetical protein